jgi:hypothetical protein
MALCVHFPSTALESLLLRRRHAAARPGCGAATLRHYGAAPLRHCGAPTLRRRHADLAIPLRVYAHVIRVAETAAAPDQQ